MSQLRTNAIVDASGGTTATVNGIPLRPGVLDPENRIINGAFDFWQRGTSFTSAGVYMCDRWFNGFNGGSYSFTRQTFSAGDTLGSNNPTYFARASVSGQSLASHLFNIAQPIESVRSYAGQTITVLGWARRSSGSGNMAVEGRQAFGTGGSPSSDVTGISPTIVTLTSSWAPFAVTMSVPSITGKTLGTTNDGGFIPYFWLSAGSDYNARTNSLGLQTIGVDLWGVHIKQGTHTTSAVDLYRQPELGPELARCQRYFWALRASVANGSYMRYATGFATGTAGASFTLIPPVTLRSTPAVSFSGSGTVALFDGASVHGSTAVAIGADGASNETINFNASTATAVLTQFRPYQLLSNANSTSYIYFDSEL